MVCLPPFAVSNECNWVKLHVWFCDFYAKSTFMLFSDIFSIPCEDLLSKLIKKKHAARPYIINSQIFFDRKKSLFRVYFQNPSILTPDGLLTPDSVNDPFVPFITGMTEPPWRYRPHELMRNGSKCFNFPSLLLFSCSDAASCL